jgi:hypothetical protein
MKPLDEMNEQEIRMEIAERKGMQRHHLEPIYMEGYCNDGEDSWDGYFCPRCQCSVLSYNSTPCCPDWPASIAAVWELLDELGPLEIGYSVENSLWSKDELFVECVIYEPIGGPNSQKWKAEERTAPLAICKAWLSWKRSEDK